MFENIFNLHNQSEFQDRQCIILWLQRYPMDSEDDSVSGFFNLADNCIPSSHPLTVVSQFKAFFC